MAQEDISDMNQDHYSDSSITATLNNADGRPSIPNDSSQPSVSNGGHGNTKPEAGLPNETASVLPLSSSKQSPPTPTPSSHTPSNNETANSLPLVLCSRPYLTRKDTLRPYCEQNEYQTPPIPRTQTPMAAYHGELMIQAPFQNLDGIQPRRNIPQQSTINGNNCNREGENGNHGPNSTDGDRSDVESNAPSSTGADGCRTPGNM